MLTKNALGNMHKRYSAVLTKCRLLNAFGSLAMVTMLILGGLVGDACAESLVLDRFEAAVVSTPKEYDRAILEGSQLFVVSGGDVTVTGKSYILYSTIKLQGGGMYTAMGSTVLKSGGVIYVDEGTYEAKDETLVDDGLISIGDGVYNARSIQLEDSSSLSVAGGVCNASYTMVNAGGSVKVDGGTYTTTGTTMVNTDGLFVVKNGSYNAKTTTIDGGEFEVSGGTCVTQGATELMDSTGMFTITGGTYQTGSTTVSNDSSFYLLGGTYITTGTTTVSTRASIWISGTYIAQGDTVITGGSPAYKNDGGIFWVEYGGTYNAQGITTVEDGLLKILEGTYNVGSSSAEWLNTATRAANIDASGLGVLAMYKPDLFNVTEGEVLVGDADDSPSSSMRFNSNSLLTVHAGNFGKYALSAPTIAVAQGAKLLVSNVHFTDGKATVQIADAGDANGLNLANGAWGCGDTSATGENAIIDTNTLHFDNALTKAESYIFDAAEGTYTLALNQVSAESVYGGTGLSPEFAAMIDEAVANGTFSELLGKWSNVLSSKDFVKAVEGLSKIQVSAGVVNAVSSVSGLATGNATNRSSFFAGSNEGSAVEHGSREVLIADNGTITDTPNPIIADAGTEGGLANGLAIWVQPMYQSVSADGFSSGNCNYGYDTDIYGASLGADYTVDNSFRYGLALHVGGGTSESSNSDFYHTENDFDFFGSTLYAGYVQNNVSISGDVSYTVTRNDLSQDVGAHSASVNDFDATAFSVGARAEYKIATDIVDMIPYLGARMTYFQTDSFDTKNGAHTVFHTSESYATTFAVPVGLVFSKSFDMDGVELTPRASLGVQFTMGDLDVEQRTAIAGGRAHSMESEVFDPVTFMGGLGLDAQFDNVTLGIDYNLGASENVMSHQVSAMVRYTF